MIYNSEVQDTTIRKATTTRNTQAIAKRLEFQANAENFKFEIKNNSLGNLGIKFGYTTATFEDRALKFIKMQSS